MQQIPIRAIPNQSFAAILDSNQWNFVIKSTIDATLVSINLNNEQVIENQRAVAGSFIIPSKYEEAGNFIFVTQNFQLPEYPKFMVTQYLIYVSPAELAIYRAPKAPPITAADFDPIAALPLRFSPRGY